MIQVAKRAAELADEFHAPVVASNSLMDTIAKAASDPNVDVTKLERLIALADRQRDKDAERAFAVAMNEAQAAIRPIAADASNPSTKSKYASYLALDKTLRPIYAKHGFSLSFDTEPAAEGMIRVLCYVSHAEGYSRTYRVDMPADGKGAKGGDVMTKTHATGAAMTYGQRYLLKMIFNIAIGEDSDNGAEVLAGPINADQFETISDLIDRASADKELFCKHFQIEAIKDLPARKYQDAIALLNTKLHRSKKA